MHACIITVNISVHQILIITLMTLLIIVIRYLLHWSVKPDAQLLQFYTTPADTYGHNFTMKFILRMFALCV